MAKRDKKAAFVRTAERRTNKVLYRLQLLGRLGNPYIYTYSEEQVDQIIEAIRSEADQVEQALRRPFRGGPTFTLGGEE